MSTITVNTTTTNDPGNTINSIGFASNDTAQGAQSFTTVGAGTVLSVDLEGARDGSSTTDLYYIQIFTDSSSVPGSMLTNGESNSHQLNDFPAVVSFKCSLTTMSPVTFTFSTPPSVSAATRYWAVCTTKGIYDTSNALRWCGDSLSAHSEIEVHSTTTPTTWGTATGQAGYLVVSIQDAAGNVTKISTLPMSGAGV